MGEGFIFLTRGYAPVKLFCPHPPPGYPRGHHFFLGCPDVLVTLFLPCPTLYKHSNYSFFQCPALFHHTHFSSDPGAAWGDGGRTIWPAHKPWYTLSLQTCAVRSDNIFINNEELLFSFTSQIHLIWLFILLSYFILKLPSGSDYSS